MRLTLVAWSMLVSVQASKAERQLHRSLFDPEEYNPRVIIDEWRKANRADYDNIGAFASDKCAGYNPPDEISVMPGSLLLTDTFATPTPYETFMDYRQRFTCQDGETVQLRLDQDRGFNISMMDYLEVEYLGITTYLSGTIESLPSDLKQRVWFDTKSSSLNMHFYSHWHEPKSGFKFDIMCKAIKSLSDPDEEGNGNEVVGMDERSGVSPTEIGGTHTIITNEHTNSSFSKEVSCQSSSERIQYRLMRERIDQAKAADFDEVAEATVKLESKFGGIYFNASDAEWVKANVRELLVFFDANVFERRVRSSYYEELLPDYYDFDVESYSCDNTGTCELVTFFIEFKCEQQCTLSNLR